MAIQKTEIRTIVWNYFKSKGFPEYGIAGLMGNLYSESGIEPNKLERLCIIRLKEYYGKTWTDETYTQAVDNGEISRERFLNPIPGKKYGYGLVQWTTPTRKAGLYDLCSKRGVSISDLTAQLDYLYQELTTTFPKTLSVLKNARSIAEASDYMLIHFEAPANASAMKATRQNYSNQIYNLYKGQSGEETKMTSKDITICGHGSGNPSTKNLYTYSASRNSQRASNGKTKGIVCVRRFKGLTDAQRKQFHDTYRTILGRNIYSQNLREYCYRKYSNGKYYSDCSSSVCLTLAQIGLNCPSYNTAGIYSSSKFENVPVTISNGQIMNPEVLKVGDFILYRGNDPSRPLQIGHVEAVYEINGSKPTPTPPSDKTALIKAGQQHSINFTGHKIKVDGDRGPETRQQAVRVLQTALNLDYNAGLEVDGSCGTLTKKALGKHYVAMGETQYMVTAAEILLYMLGKNPNGVECPGHFGNGLKSAAGTSKITADMFLSYLN